MNRKAIIGFNSYFLMASLFHIFALHPLVKAPEKTGISIHSACSCGCSESTVSCCCNSSPIKVEFQSCSSQQSIFITMQLTFLTVTEKKAMLVFQPLIKVNSKFIKKKYLSQEILDEIDHPPQTTLF